METSHSAPHEVYIAIDELYDGPFCVLSLVDNRAFIRLSFRVLEHDPTQNDIRRFLADFKARLDVRGLTVRGVTTDGSELYPEPLKGCGPMCPIKSVSSTSSRKLPRRCCTPWPQPARNSATAFPSSRAADPARPSEPSPARPPGNNSR